MENTGVIIGHIPAGYLATVLLRKYCRKWGINGLQVLLASLFGSIVPDTDLLWFYLVDNRQYHHHTYWPHYPIVWGAIMTLALLCFHATKYTRHSSLALVFGAAGMLHMVLDSIVGDIWWFAPWVDAPYSLFTVPARFDYWWLNFIFHWSFILEIALCVSAYCVRVGRPDLSRTHAAKTLRDFSGR